MARAFAWHAKGHQFDPGNLHKSPDYSVLFMKQLFLYIIFSKHLDKYYVGYTVNLEKRIREHIDGISSFTAKAMDWELKYSEQLPDRISAISREKEIKKRKVENILNG